MKPTGPKQDPYDSDKTVLLPTPGARRSGDIPAVNSNQDSRRPSVEHVFHPHKTKSEVQVPGLNPLVNAASELLSLSGSLQGTITQPHVDRIRQHAEHQIRAYKNAALNQGASLSSINHARYALCALLDETVLNTPWGHESAWRSESLLSTFYDENSGEESFFRLLSRVSQECRRNPQALDLLELLAICLLLGFEGMYRARVGGRRQLEQIQANVLEAIAIQRGNSNRTLSPHWRGVQNKRNPLISYVPLWVIGAVAVAVLLISFFAFSYSLNGASYPVFEALSGIGRETMSAPKQVIVSPKPQAVAPRLSNLLDKEASQGLISLNEQSDRTTIVIQGDGLFLSDRAVLEQTYYPLLNRIAEALAEVPGQIIVIGHTDNVPSRSLRFRSNWELSRARAKAVMTLLAQILGSTVRLVAEGRADTEPLVPNDSPANRARNRRVEIVLVPQR